MTYRPNYLLIELLNKTPDVISTANTAPEIVFDMRTRNMIKRGLEQDTSCAIYELKGGM
jgi:hypothetical protein